MIACGKQLGEKENVSKSMIIAFIMNSIALGMAVIMLLGWHSDLLKLELLHCLPYISASS